MERRRPPHPARPYPGDEGHLLTILDRRLLDAAATLISCPAVLHQDDKGRTATVIDRYRAHAHHHAGDVRRHPSRGHPRAKLMRKLAHLQSLVLPPRAAEAELKVDPFLHHVATGPANIQSLDHRRQGSEAEVPARRAHRRDALQLSDADGILAAQRHLDPDLLRDVKLLQLWPRNLRTINLTFILHAGIWFPLQVRGESRLATLYRPEEV